MHLNPWHILVIAMAGWMNREQSAVIEYFKEESRGLRELLGDKRPRLNDAQRRRLTAKGKALGRRVFSQIASLVTPDTILAWYRKLIARKWDYSKRHGPGRPRVMPEIAELTVRMARENPGWGYTTIKGVLANLGHTAARERVRNLLKERGIEPAPERSKRMPWSTFLKAHWGSIAAADLFTVEIWSMGGLTRYYVLFLIKLSSRRVHVAGITEYPHGEWMKQIGRNLTDAFDGSLLEVRYLILDRDRIYTEAFRDLLKQAGIKVIRLPPRSPNLNAYAERFVRTIKEGCLDRMIFFGERSLQNATREFLEHYHRERNHQGIGNRLIDPPHGIGSLEGKVACRERLGGMLRYYHRKAA